MTTEELVVKAVRSFKKQFKNCEIRSLYIAETSGEFKHYNNINVCISYVEEDGGEQKSTYVSVEK